MFQPIVSDENSVSTTSLHEHRRSGHGILLCLIVGAASVAISFCDPCFAQPASTASPPAATALPPVQSEPGVTTASYGDWLLRCQRLDAGNASRLCEVAQTMQVQGQTAPVAQFAVGRLPGQNGLRATAVLPANVSFPSSVRVTEAKNTGQGLDLAWRRCIPGGCFADAIVSETMLKSWRAAAEPGRISFKDADGREIVVPLSFHGFAQALDALAKERS